MAEMTNADLFLREFGIYATELWAMPEQQLLEWLNAPCDRERLKDMLHAQLNEAHNEGYDVGYWVGRRDYEKKWIPCSERLPNPHSGEYLVTINDGAIYTDVLWFDSPGDGRYESCFYKTDDDGHGVACDDVVAWMSLPEPYKESD